MTSFSTKTNDSDGSHLQPDDKNKQWQREFLMERLRSHYTQSRTFPELSKAIRMSMLEKRYALDAVEKSNLQKCLDSMQHCIKVTTRQGLIERLESLSRQLGLKFMEDSSGLFISSDMFFLEIILDPNDGKLKDVKVHHECKIEQQSCSELVTCLMNGDFADFTNQLEGLSSIYQLNAEPKVKSKAFVALQAMEMDLYNLYKWKSYNKDITSLLIESPVGLVQKRRGGHPMKLTYFVSPYDILNPDGKGLTPLTSELIKGKDIGMSVTVNLEASSANKLQILPSVTLSKENNYPTYSPLSQNNSTLLPATFVLRLNKSLPVCDTLLNAIGIPHSIDGTEITCLMSLTVQGASKGVIQNVTKGLFVTLPDQNHCYFFTENKNLRGSIITNVPFTEPSQVPKILSALKQQALFYTLLASCIRTGEKTCNIESTTILEVNALSIYKISVALQHPYDESMVSVEFDLKDIANIKVNIYSLTNNYESSSKKLTKIAQTSISIPITVRYLLNLWNHEQLNGFNLNNHDNGNFDSNNLGGSVDHVNGQPNRQSGGGNIMGNDFQSNKINRSGSGTGNDSNSFPPGQSRQFFHTNSSGLNMMATDSGCSSSGNGGGGTGGMGLVNQFNLKSDNLKNTLNQEDFCKSPKSCEKNSPTNLNLNNTGTNFENNSSDNSLGVINSSNTNNVTVSKTSSLTIEKITTTNSNSKLETMQTDIWKKPGGSDNKNTVSITPVLTNSINQNDPLGMIKSGNGKNDNKRSIIEIIPITNNVGTSISITPINSNLSDTSSKSSVQSSTSGCSKKKVDDKDSKVEKKRRKKDSSALLMPSSSKTLDNIELKIIEITGDSNTSISRKISGSSSNTSNTINQFKKQISGNASTSSSSINSSSGKKSSSKQSSSYSSPGNSSSKSPLSFGSSSNSPNSKSKHHSLTSGKPSLTALKSATSSFSSDPIESKESFSLIKMNQINETSKNHYDIFQDHEENDVFEFSTSSDYTSSLQNPQTKNRKSSLTAVIDKLKQAQNSTTDEINEKLEKMHKESASTSLSSQIMESSLNDLVAKMNSEYMIKPSLDGMKLTINKTKTDSLLKREKYSSNSTPNSGNSSPNMKKFSSSYNSGGNNNSGNSSPKKHTGLKPGVSAGPASKKSSGSSEKSQSSKSQKSTGLPKSNSSDCLSANVTKSGYTTGPVSGSATLSKSLSSNSLNSESSNSSNSSSSFRKDKSYSKSKSNSGIGRSSIDQTDSAAIKLLQFSSNKNIMEGFIKSLDTNFQIPKLSQKLSSTSSAAAPSTSSADDNKNTSLEKISATNLIKNYSCSNLSSTGNLLTDNISKRNNIQDQHKQLSNNLSNNIPADITLHKIDDNNKLLKYSQIDKNLLNFENKIPMNLSSKNDMPTDLSKKDYKIQNTIVKSQDIFSNNSSGSMFKMNQHFPTSSAVSVRILKSPVPSPISVTAAIQSPHTTTTNSPCITDDEIMDETLVGISSK